METKQDKEKSKKVVGYCRVSTSKQDYSLESQRREIEQYAAAAGLEVVDVIEVKESGKKNGDGPSLKRAIELCKSQGAVLVVAKLDRLSRNASFLMSIFESEVSIKVLNMPDLNTLTVGIFAAMAQHEREEISRRTKKGLEQARIAGKKLGGGNVFGPAARESSLDSRRKASMEYNATYVLNHVRMFLGDGHSLNETARRLNALGIKTVRGKAFTAQAVKNLLKLHGIERGVKK